MPAGDRASIRITADVFQQATAPNDAFYRGWVIRAKYAYLQYDYLKSATGWNGLVRGGMLHNVVIDHVEIILAALDFPDADRALRLFLVVGRRRRQRSITFPNKFGELYADDRKRARLHIA